MRSACWALMLATFAASTLIAGNAQAGAPASPLEQEAPVILETQGLPETHFFRSTATPDSLMSALVTGADYLQAMQADITDDNAGNGIDGVNESPDDPDDGGWDWRVTTPPAPVAHTTGASPTNLYGVTALGLYYAYAVTGDAGYLTAMKDAADAMIVNPSVRSASDVVYLLLYNTLPSVTGTAYEDSAKAKYDGRIATYGSADSLAGYIRDIRGITQGYPNGIIAWDIGAWVLAASLMDDRFGGYAADADSMAEVIWQDSFNSNPGLFDIVADAGWDSTFANVNYWWYNLGISGLITGFVASDTHTDELAGLATLITDSQYASGAVSGSYGANPNDEDWQSTAYAAMALADYDFWSFASEIGEMGSWIADTQDTLTGGWRYSSNNHYPEVCGENVCGLYFAYLAANSVAADPTGLCLSTVDTCVSVPVDLTRSETAQARGASVTIQLSPELELCGSITQGTWISGFANKVYQVVDNGGGSYTIDQSILGTPCGTTSGGQLFEVPVQKTSGVTTDSTGTITVTSVIVRDCSNQPLPGIPGAPATIPIDLTAVAAVTDLTATQDKGGNGTDGRTDIDLTFSVTGADSVMVFRKAYGDYPEYNDGTGAVPSVPTSPANAVANGWTLTGVTLSGQGDEPATRDFWYYVLFTEDACNNVSAASNMTGGTLNYHLGDVSNGVTNGQGDNLVGPPDVSLLGAHYGVTLVFGDSVNYLDVGPTTDFSVDALPTTDNQVGFEDLMMFAINYNQVSRSGPDAIASVPSDVAERPVLALAVDRGSGLTARLVLRDHEAAVKGVHAVVSYDRDALELLGVSRGGLFDEQGGPVFFETLDREEGLVVDAAILGRDLTFAGSGEVAVLTFREKKPGAALKLATADLRGVDNRFFGERPVTAGATAPAAAPVVSGPALPTELELVGARPNPFDRATDIVFRLPESRSVSVRVYDVGGRLVRTLVDRALPAGEHRATWDGRDGLGRTASAGIYFYTFRAGDHRETHKLLHVR